MKKEFIPYEQSLELKELGFDEPCFGYYSKETNWHLCWLSNSVEPYNHNDPKKYGNLSAPLYQQAFRWFREKHGFYNQIHKRYGWEGIIRNSVNGTLEWNDGTYNSPEEAELACLKKLIEIVKNK